MHSGHYHYVTCTLCGSSDYKAWYKFNYQKFGLKAPLILVKCNSCGHIYNNPRLETAGLSALYNQDYHIIDQECQKRRAWLPALQDYLNKIRPIEEKISGRSLLDIGCGMGFLMKIAKDNGWQVEGVDVSTTAVEYARNIFGLDARLGRFEDVDFKGKKFNLILGLDLLEHLESPLEFIKRCYDLLEKNGLLIIEIPNIGSIYKKITGRFWVGFNPYHIHFFTPKGLKKLFSQSQFKIADIYTTFNDIFAKRNLWRWVSNQPFLMESFRKIWLMKNKIFATDIYQDIAKIDASCANLEKTVNFKKLIEPRNNFIAKRLLGDQLIAVLSKE